MMLKDKKHTISTPAVVKADRSAAFGIIRRPVSFIMLAYDKL
jgi:hypothetical protein